jgi:hypothetical protein
MAPTPALPGGGAIFAGFLRSATVSNSQLDFNSAVLGTVRLQQ